ncbi:MAG: trigger factor [candidate division Zixibacteria bacterium]|nr:trigger factor [candidate division Zixibacteria bacterium]
MKVTVNSEPNCKKILDIEVPHEEIQAEIDKQILLYRAKANIPGFRRGKAPLEVVKRQFIDGIKGDVFETLVPKAYDEAISQEDLHPVEQPKLSNVEFDDDKPLKFRAEIEVRPEFEPKKYTGLKAERKVRAIEDKDVEESLSQMQRQNAEFTPVERKCHDNDLVITDLIKKYDKLNQLKDDKMEDVEIDLGSESVLKEFKEGLRGMGIGEMKDIEIKYPEDYTDKQFAGNEVKFTALVKEVKEIKLPELNDDFAKNFAQMENLDKLKEQFRENMTLQANQEADNALKGDLIKQIVDNNRFDVPETMVEKYLQSVTEDFKKRYQDVDEVKLKQSYRSVGEDTIRWQFIYREIADKESIKVIEEDRAAWVKNFANMYNMDEKTAREALGKAGKFNDIDDTLIEQKVLDFIKENSKISS